MAPRKKKEVSPEEPTKVVAAAGIAAGGGGEMSKRLEEAMRKALLDIQNESESIWADSEISPEDKQSKIAALNDPKAMQARMMEYREKALAEVVVSGQ